MVGRLPQQLGMVTARSVEHLIIRVLRPRSIEWSPGVITPRRPLLRPRVPLLLSIELRMLATAGALLILLHGRHLVRTVPVVRRISLPEILHRPRLVRSGSHIGSDDRFGRYGRLHWVTQSIHVSYLDCIGEGGRHISLQLLPQHTAMTAPLATLTFGAPLMF